mmetsp:Transcript_28862/g.78195  ORF Transcript_28862/g.78195 Transcript_28862/m.78195 type:complete len:544 (-) Transcript_28862:1178-2809(-)|eukprot:CAMPEP_0172366378 /NCGR_PEP_ID=MMETSP1060-20121228/14798_1 /TAXON_ID=37318 /ORGANISM="Pseudo-nitzschia pungens, Strain cf. cingulata" /LENGTH=543 /DNA_ID=CAMNT_0013090203 /DNA_START=82 /DNA_END=1713 /DNA_ORIENTATION=+
MALKRTFFLLCVVNPCESFVTQPYSSKNAFHATTSTSLDLKTEWTSDFDGFVGDGGDEGNDDEIGFSDFLSKSNGDRNRDLTAVQTRLFSLGEDVIVNDFVGNMGFEEVTDWEYYYENEEDPNDRNVVNPNPFDGSKPKRTRTNSGSVVRVFRGELVGRLGATVRSKGLDQRILIKEYTGKLAFQLARNDQRSIAELQSKLVENYDDAANAGWIQSASSRSVLARTDDKHVGNLLKDLRTAPYVGILGEVNLAELEGEMDPNDFYRALGVAPPKPGAVWIVFEYAGLNTIASYTATAPEKRRAKQPPKKSFFGGFIEPPPLPPFRERANFVVKGVMAKSLSALASIHEAGIAHRSIGRNSLVISSPNQNKAEASSIYFTRISGLTIKLSDFGFSCLLEDSAKDEEFLSRSRAFGLSIRKGDTSQKMKYFSMAEDLHALGFVFLGLLLVSLSDLPSSDSPMPATDEDTIQKNLNEIFNQDFEAFREYVEAEEVWSELVKLLDDKDGAGWDVLQTLFRARETAAESTNGVEVVSARGLLANPFFQ